MNRISVLVPVYDCAEVIGQAIGNILDQTAPPFEIVVADDGSEDDIAARVDALRPDCAARGAQLTFVQAEHRGRGAARNLAAASAEGELVAWFDADDLWDPAKLATQAADFERLRPEHPAGRLLLTCDYLRYGSARGTAQLARPAASIGIEDVISVRARRHIQLQTVFGPRAVFLETPFDAELNRAEDFEFALRFAAKGGKFVNPAREAAPLVHYFRSGANFSKEGANGNRRILRENAAILAANHVDARALLADKLANLRAVDLATDPPRALPPGPVPRAVPGVEFARSRPRLERLGDGSIRVHLARGAEVDYALADAEGAEIARGTLRDAAEIAQREIVGWFMAGARAIVVRPRPGARRDAWFPAERLMIARAASGLLSIAGPPPARPSRNPGPEARDDDV
jgi:glycosyltransferase involved in cell wall biosynthesis